MESRGRERGRRRKKGEEGTSKQDVGDRKKVLSEWMHFIEQLSARPPEVKHVHLGFMVAQEQEGKGEEGRGI